METGKTIAGKYRLNRTLGMGGMASVWSATNVFTDREFAVKFMLPQLARTPEAAQRFFQEAKVSGRINHPNIIEMFDVGQAEDGSLFLVMELLTGTSLDAALRRQTEPMTVRAFLHIMRDVANALSAAHRCGVVHRDLKPTNIFLHNDRDGHVVTKVLDFGVSKIIEEGEDAGLTIVGTILGSPLYMSPEQAMGAEGIDGRTDVFAFGSILFEAICGQRAYAAANLNALIVAIATTQPRRVEDVAPHVPHPVRALIQDCMVTDKENRIGSFDAIAQRLDTLLAMLADSPLTLPSHRRAEPTPEPHLLQNGLGKRVGNTGERAPPSGRIAMSVSPVAVSTQTRLSRAARVGTTHPRAASSTSRRESRRLRGLALGGIGLALGALAIGIGASFVRSDRRASASAGGLVTAALGHTGRTSAAAVAPLHAPAPSAPEPAPVPVISVDSLPVAARAGNAGRNSGRLSVAATAGRCAIAVDGVSRGVTPLRSFELPAGTHRVDCAAASGATKTANVNVTEGTEAHFQFTMAE